MKRSNLDHTLTELAALKKSVRAAERKTIEFVRNKAEKLLSQFDFGADVTCFTKEDFDITLNEWGIALRVNVLRYRHLPGEPEKFVENEELESNPIWVRDFESELVDLLDFKKHGVMVSINPSLFPK